MKTLATTDSYDWDLSGGTFHFKKEDDAIAQNIVSRLLNYLGENFLDRSRGIDYNQDVFGKNPDFSLIETIVRFNLESVPGVNNVVSVVAQYKDEQQRIAAVEATVTTQSGAELLRVQVPIDSIF